MGKAILALITSLPKILTYLEALGMAIQAYIEKRKLAKMQRAGEAARVTKNTCELERSFDPTKKCPPDSQPKP